MSLIIVKWGGGKNNNLPTTEDYKRWINEALYYKGLTSKNHTYLSHIRTQIRAITDTKEEYESLRDTILGAYKDMRSGKYDDTNMHTYVTTSKGEKMDDHHIDRSMLDKGREGMDEFPTFQSVGTISTNDGSCINRNNLPFSFDMFSYPGDTYKTKYTWSLGKDGLMITKSDPSKIEIPHGKDFESGRANRIKKFDTFNNIVKVNHDLKENVEKEYRGTDEYKNLQAKYPEIFDSDVRVNISHEQRVQAHDKFHEDNSKAMKKYTRKHIGEITSDFKKEVNNTVDKDVYDVFYVSNKER